ncbi:hypothetical protein [Deinococcus arenicola]|uniref:Uncharacterized protein n=1 Tax=Deinococcus arenicola TaxID=2994950 RepID=A0ABU4DQL9_9DEIO|nr:hypothetical protein [Deinococcus sp. ZS9-10]MDV6374727.1 hypothetical protein [Deinococcus sp. ZS9-10]
MTDSKKPENPTFSTEMTDKQRTEVRGETPRGAKVEQGAHMSQDTVDENVERDSSAGLQGKDGWKGVDYDEKSEKQDDEK